MTTVRIPITRPMLDEAELSAIAEVLASGHLVQGSRVAEFERLVADHSGVAHAVAVSSGTSALRVALHALGIGQGDVVLVTPYSWIATANVIELCGATPVFVDIDAGTFNMDAERLREQLAAYADVGSLERVRAIMPVHTFGNPAQIAEIAEVAAAYSIPVVEDAACALGASQDGRPAGSFGRIGCFSFHPRKIITTGEGGMVVTNDPEIDRFARAFRNHGQQPVDGVTEFVLAGDNLRMTDLQGAIGIVQMSRLPGLVEDRARLAMRYDRLIAPLGFTPQRRAAGAAVQAYVALGPESMTAGHVIRGLRDRGIEATIGTNAIPFTRHFAERYAGHEADLPNTVAVSRRAVTLPLYPQMPECDQDDVVETLGDLVAAGAS
jgi:dTDP-4-amino-4,6-dideoxygalactose transaminase